MKTATQSSYISTADEIVKRIAALIPKYPQILKMKSPYDLLDIKVLKLDDLEPSLFQVSWALGKAQQEAKKRRCK